MARHMGLGRSINEIYARAEMRRRNGRNEPKHMLERPEERDYYAIEDVGDGHYVHHRCFYWQREDLSEDPELEWCRTDLTFSIVPLSGDRHCEEGLRELVDIADQAVAQYDYWMSAEDARHEQAGMARHLPLSQVTALTPPGEYWCRFHE